MSRVPRIRFKGFEEDWEQRKLGEVIQERNIRTSDFDKFPIFSLTIESGVTPKTERYERSSLVTKTEDLFKVVKPNEFVTNPMNLRFGALGYNTQKYDISVSGYYDVFSIDGNNCSGFWNAYFKTQQVMNVFDNVATGSLVEKKRVKYSTLKQIYVSVPSAIEEKNKISKFMSFTDHLITLHQRKLEKLKIIKKSMLENLFPQNGEKTPKIRFSGFTEDWEQRKHGEVFIYLRNNTLSREELNDEDGFAQSIHYGDVLIKYGECLNVSKELLPYIDNKNIVNKFKKFYIQNGDVIIADTAEDETVGKCIEISGIVDHNIISGLHTIPLRPVNKFAYGYLGFYLNSNSYHNQLKPLMQGIKVTSISKNLLKTTTLNYPSNIQEQKIIGRYFDALNHLITLHQSKLDKLQKIKKSMLESMFV